MATKRVKHAIKSDIPSVADHVSKLLHIGKATVDKLTDLRAAFQEEGESGDVGRVRVGWGPPGALVWAVGTGGVLGMTWLDGECGEHPP